MPDALRPWERFERRIAGYRLASGPRDPRVEHVRFPGLVAAYRRACPTPEIAPTQGAYADGIARLVAGSAVPEPDPAAVRARAGRAYISLVVQHHAYLVLADAFGAVAWDDDLDLRYGVDLVVIGSDAVAVGLALCAPTARSRAFAATKQARYQRLPFRVQTLEVEPYAYTAGPFWLYRPEVLVGAVLEVLRAHWTLKRAALEAAAVAAYAAGRRRPKASRHDFLAGVAAALDALLEDRPRQERLF